MKRVRLMFLLVATALTAVALSVPASAFAVEWTREAQPLEEPEVIELDGNLGISTFLFASIDCDVSGEAILSPGDEGEITELTIDPESCQATGIFSPCKVVEAEVSTPISLQATIEELKAEVTTGALNFRYEFSKCGFLEFVPKYESITLTPDNQWAFSDFQASGLNTTGQFTLAGDLDVTPSETYGISE
jgi:hypothetical protein